MAKAKIVGELGEQELLLPALVNEALAANDRAKYLMSLLQAAREHASQPELTATDLRQERLACGVEQSDLDTVASRCHMEGADVYFLLEVRRIFDGLIDNVRRMLAPFQARPCDSLTKGAAAAKFEQRLQALLSQTPALADDRISRAFINRLTFGQRDDGDSLHVLVMDLHKELNGLQKQLATEAINGALVYGLRDEDRSLVEAFMSGVNQTRELKFDHPGLSTTATRSGPRLIIQNDLGLTEAHVLIVHVEEKRVTLTYTDIHIERLDFFQGLFDRFAVEWQDTVSRRATEQRGDLYHLCVGTYTSPDQAELLAYLTFLGSRLVF
jgi:hypothetical protein